LVERHALRHAERCWSLCTDAGSRPSCPYLQQPSGEHLQARSRATAGPLSASHRGRSVGDPGTSAQHAFFHAAPRHAPSIRSNSSFPVLVTSALRPANAARRERSCAVATLLTGGSASQCAPLASKGSSDAGTQPWPATRHSPQAARRLRSDSSHTPIDSASSLRCLRHRTFVEAVLYGVKPFDRSARAMQASRPDRRASGGKDGRESRRSTRGLVAPCAGLAWSLPSVVARARVAAPAFPITARPKCSRRLVSPSRGSQTAVA